MDQFEIIRAFMKPVHIWIGVLILLTGLIQLILKKSGPVHRTAGRIYHWAMIVSFLTSFPTAVIKGHYFLAIVGIFAIFLSFTGARFARFKSRPHFHFVDYAATWFFALSALGMLTITLLLFFGDNKMGGAILSVFTFIFATGALRDFYTIVIKKNKEALFEKGNWMFNHIGRMVGSYIAATTAFLVNVQPYGNSMFNWLLPTVIGSIFIARTIRRYKQKSAQ